MKQPRLLGLLNVDKTPELKITFAGNEAYREGEITASVKIVDPRPIGEFTIMTTPITYTSDVEKLKQELYDRITWTNGVKPSINQFTMQVKTGEIKTVDFLMSNFMLIWTRRHPPISLLVQEHLR